MSSTTWPEAFKPPLRQQAVVGSPGLHSASGPAFMEGWEVTNAEPPPHQTAPAAPHCSSPAAARQALRGRSKSGLCLNLGQPLASNNNNNNNRRDFSRARPKAIK
ncbi:unnamed protein product [Boreogadus saida]